MNNNAESVRDRRVSREEEKRLLDTALHKMNDGVHMFVGELLHDRIIGALELCCRRGEGTPVDTRCCSCRSEVPLHERATGSGFQVLLEANRVMERAVRGFSVR